MDAVTSSAPLASRALSITCWFGYRAVPTISRDFSVVPAITRGSVMRRYPRTVASAALQRTDDLDLVAGRKLSGGPFRTTHDCAVDGDGEKACRRVDTTGDEQLCHGRRGDFFLDAVDPHPRHRASIAPAGSDLSAVWGRGFRKRSGVNGCALLANRPVNT